MLGNLKSRGKRGWNVWLDHVWRDAISVSGGLEEEVGHTSCKTAIDYREGVSPSPFQHCFPMVPHSIRLTNVLEGEQRAEGTTSDLHWLLQGETETRKSSAESYKTSHNLQVAENNRFSLCSSTKDVQPLLGCPRLHQSEAMNISFFLDADKSTGRGLRLLLTFLLSYVFCVVLSHCLRVIQGL